jgi:hypothetical protein
VNGRLPVRYLDPHFARRFGELPRPAQRRALELLGRIANGQALLGKPCGYQPRTGNLDDCRKVYFDVSVARSPDYRLIYRVLPDESRPAEIEAITVGRKYTYDAAGNRDTIYVRVAALLERI